MPRINIDVFMQRIREEASRAETVACLHDKQNNEFLIQDFLKYEDEEFIRNAYRYILRREPDADGISYCLSMLRSYQLSKIAILVALRCSKEGRKNHIKIKGLFVRYFIYAPYLIPKISYILKFFVTLIRLPRILANILGNIQEHKTVAVRTVSAIKGELKLIMEQIGDHIKEANKRELPELISTEKVKNEDEDYILDTVYAAFENQFRGTREEVKERFKVYLPYIEKTRTGTEDSPVLDIGCGRGEWIELLRENGYVAKGIDMNRIMVEQCREFGLNVMEADVIEYLKKQRSSSFGAVTGFHIIEHFSLKTLLTLFDESLRVLRYNGIIIFETPNPENLIVGACDFYRDPTHKKPIPPDTLKFLLETMGFKDSNILRFRPLPFSLNDAMLQNLLFGATDYAVIGYKNDKSDKSDRYQNI